MPVTTNPMMRPWSRSASEYHSGVISCTVTSTNPASVNQVVYSVCVGNRYQKSAKIFESQYSGCTGPMMVALPPGLSTRNASRIPWSG